MRWMGLVGLVGCRPETTGTEESGPSPDTSPAPFVGCLEVSVERDQGADGVVEGFTANAHDAAGHLLTTTTTATDDGLVEDHTYTWEEDRVASWTYDRGSDGIDDVVESYTYDDTGHTQFAHMLNFDPAGALTSTVDCAITSDDAQRRIGMVCTGDQVFTFTRTFDGDLLLEESTDQGSDGTLDSLNQYTYDDLGREVLMEQFVAGMTPWYREETTYAPDGLSATTMAVLLPSDTDRYEYTFDAEGRTIAVDMYYDPDADIPSVQMTTTYDDDGRAVAATYFVPSSGYREDTAWSYDGRGNLTVIEVGHGSGPDLRYTSTWVCTE